MILLSFHILANNIKYIPVISGELLENYIKTRSIEFGIDLNQKETDFIKHYTGGILQLTKEYLRNYNKPNLMELKIRGVWARIPKSYREVILKIFSGNKLSTPNDKNTKQALALLGVSNLKVFKQKINILEPHSTKNLERALTHKELEIYKLFTSSKGKVIAKDQIAKIIWGENFLDNYSDWGVDQTISRFRKKISTSSIDPEILKTLKGKGYIWQKNI